MELIPSRRQLPKPMGRVRLLRPGPCILHNYYCRTVRAYTDRHNIFLYTVLHRTKRRLLLKD